MLQYLRRICLLLFTSALKHYESLNNNKVHIKSKWLLFPPTGILIFFMLYVVAALLYPGGSQADKASTGFSWMNNYWCNLLNEKAMRRRAKYCTASRYLRYGRSLHFAGCILVSVRRRIAF